MNYLNYNFKYFMFHREGEIHTFLIYIFSRHFNYSSIPFINFHLSFHSKLNIHLLTLYRIKSHVSHFKNCEYKLNRIN